MKWTPEEVESLKQNYPRFSRTRLSKEFLSNRTPTAINLKAFYLGLRKRDHYWNPRGRWTPEEDAILTEHWTSTREDKLMVLLPRRSWSAMKSRAHILGLKRHANCFPPNYELIDFNLDESQKGYVAAMLDGEGTAGIRNYKKILQYRKGSVGLNLVFSNNHRGMLETIKGWLDIGKVFQSKAKKEKYRKCLRYVIWRTLEVYSLLKVLEPLLIIKREQAKLIIAFCESRLNRGVRAGINLSYNEHELRILKGYSELGN